MKFKISFDSHTPSNNIKFEALLNVIQQVGFTGITYSLLSDTNSYSFGNYLDKKEAAIYCGVGTKRFYALCKTDPYLISKFRKLNGKTLISVNDLILWSSDNDCVQVWMVALPYYHKMVTEYKQKKNVK